MAALGLVTVTGCGASTIADLPSPPDPSAADPASSTYASRTFVLPLTVEPGPGLQSPPIDATNLIAWDAADSEDSKIRFMVPVEIYRPGRTTAEAVPADYGAYVRSLAGSGATVAAVKRVEVGGNPATLLTMTRSGGTALDGSLGCPERGADQHADCFAPQADFLLRVAVLQVGGKPLLIWARVPAARPDRAFLDGFEKMLSTVRFR